ncbi:MAG: A/G-specific adenine glycosylase [Planctomycetota bacterium]
MATSGFAPRLLGWFDRARRDLPWRRTRDPWAIWVSEIMLQQTRVEAVRAPFERFLARYPTPAAFAAASDDEVMVAWRGLGYYRRARLLRDGARRVAEVHDGVVPDTVDELRELPGIGPYTLGAVASIAFGHGQPAVDGNVERVVSRHRGLAEPIGTTRARKAIGAQVLAWMDRARAGDFNQAMMELGATVCTPTSPACDGCPVGSDCIAMRDGRTAELPVKKAPRKAVDVIARAVVIARGGEVLGYRVPDDQPNAGQVDLPGPGVLCDCDPEDLAAAVRERFGAEIRVREPLAAVRHAITHHRISLHAHAAELRKRGRLRWFARDAQTPWTTPARKVFAKTFLDSGAPEA